MWPGCKEGCRKWRQLDRSVPVLSRGSAPESRARASWLRLCGEGGVQLGIWKKRKAVEAVLTPELTPAGCT